MTTSDFAIEHRLGRVLGIGSVISTTLLAAGLLAFFLAPSLPVTGWLLNAGLLLLMATPVARVIVATLGYFLNRDWLFAVLAFLVLAVLTAGVWIAVTAR